jgi:hypothetical protein
MPPFVGEDENHENGDEDKDGGEHTFET